jgi:hypothetical protein
LYECPSRFFTRRIPREDLVAAFGATRDAWIAEDETETAGTPAGIPGGGSWLGANAFYDGAMDSLRAALVPGSDVKVYFVTTKQVGQRTSHIST